ncbi:hypothetical protein [Pseudonocardia phyllosphaerae]|uniref:hypothetical protein n=1 Tax=Pseudonocardia phyllosphaerae TaxID=3390502 RepID=UPI00397C1C3D
MTAPQPPFAPQAPHHNAWQQFHAWQQHQAQVAAESSRRLANAALFCGFLGFFLFGIVLGPVAFALGLTASNRLAVGQPGKTEASVAMVFGVIDVVAFFVLAAIIL